MQEAVRYQTIEEYYETAVNDGRLVVSKHRTDTSRIRGLQRDGVVERIMVIGRYAATLIEKRAEYGAQIIDRYSTDIDMHPNLIREARRAYLFFDGRIEKLGAWIERKVEETGGVLWADVRRKIVRSIDDPLERVQYTMTEVERAGEKLERKREELQEQILFITDTEITKEAVGILTRTGQELADGLISNYTTDWDGIGVPKNTIPRSDVYKKFIQKQPCCAHQDCHDPAEAAHVESGGKAIKGSDFSMIPLCHDPHAFSHQKGWVAAQEKYDFNVTEQVAKHLHKFLTGRDLRFPLALIT